MSTAGMFAYFESGRGVLVRLTPRARLLCGAICWLTLMTLNLEGGAGVFLFAGVVIGFISACATPLRYLVQLGALSMIMFIPFVLPSALVQADALATDLSHGVPLVASGGSWLSVLLKGVASVLMVTATLSTVSFSEFSGAIVSLPIPLIVKLLTVQIIQQSLLLLDEFRNVLRVLALRAVPVGIRSRLEVVRELPVVWMLRSFQRSQRVEMCMELRGYGSTVSQFHQQQFRMQDWVALGAASCCAIAAIALRLS